MPIKKDRKLMKAAVKRVRRSRRANPDTPDTPTQTSQDGEPRPATATDALQREQERYANKIAHHAERYRARDIHSFIAGPVTMPSLQAQLDNQLALVEDRLADVEAHVEALNEQVAKFRRVVLGHVR